MSGVFPCALSKTLMRVVLAVVALKKTLGGIRVDWVRSQKTLDRSVQYRSILGTSGLMFRVRLPRAIFAK